MRFKIVEGRNGDALLGQSDFVIIAADRKVIPIWRGTHRSVTCSSVEEAFGPFLVPLLGFVAMFFGAFFRPFWRSLAFTGSYVPAVRASFLQVVPIPHTLLLPGSWDSATQKDELNSLQLDGLEEQRVNDPPQASSILSSRARRARNAVSLSDAHIFFRDLGFGNE
jgi:hypothetical protein